MDVIVVDDSNFETQAGAKGRLAVVEFSTREKKTAKGTANASARMDPIFDEVAKGYSDTGKVAFFRVEIALDKNLSDFLSPITSKKYGINHGPTMVFIKDGKEVVPQLVGQYPAKDLKDKVDKALDD
ncbi:thioredoxin family protein [Pseudomonas sp. UBA1879]|uniref:thioredoxin family protein n=1 Tax=Pseudomonas sp. UBA1879 TaxID=1947305 RepID=UPI0025D530F0|nr:thioredoxin family protein [Pseudomonas sp. UBA1879]